MSRVMLCRITFFRQMIMQSLAFSISIFYNLMSLLSVDIWRHIWTLIQWWHLWKYSEQCNITSSGAPAYFTSYNMLHQSSVWVWKGVFEILWSGRYTLSYTRGHNNYDGWSSECNAMFSNRTSLQVKEHPRRYETLTRCWFNVGPATTTVDYRLPSIGSMSRESLNFSVRVYSIVYVIRVLVLNMP